MTVTAIGDILINTKPYLISRKGYHIGESARSSPRFGGATDKEFIFGDNWTRFGQSDFIGDSLDDWVGDGPFQTGYGLDISAVSGQVKVAKALTSAQADASNAAGYIAFAAGTTRLWFLGKTDGTGWHSVGAGFTSVANCLAGGVTPNSWVEYKGTYYVGASNGKMYSNTGGATFTLVSGPGGVATALYMLAVYKGKLWAGSSNALWNWDGVTWRQSFIDSVSGLSNVSGLPIMGKVANALLYFMTQGPQAMLYMTDTNQLHQLYSFGSDYLPKAMTFAEALMIWGGNTDDSSTRGSVHRLDASGLTQIYEYGTDTTDNTIYSAIEYGGKVVWSANSASVAGLGVYDPTLDIFNDSQMGFYISSVSAISSTVNGIAQFGNILYCGLAGTGIYKQGTPGTYSFTSCMYDGGTKNLNKIWGFGEIKHSALIAGQTVNLYTSKNGTTFTLWVPTTQAGGDVASFYPTPPTTPYKSPYLQYAVSGTANGSDLYLFDISLAYIDAPDNPKREWDLVLELEGGPNSENGYQTMRDESANTRSVSQMVTELNALWNTVTTYDDLDGTQYNVVFRAPKQRTDDINKDVASGAVTDLVVNYSVHLVQM